MDERSKVKTQNKRGQNYYFFKALTTSYHRNLGKVGSSICRWLRTLGPNTKKPAKKEIFKNREID